MPTLRSNADLAAVISRSMELAAEEGAIQLDQFWPCVSAIPEVVTAVAPIGVAADGRVGF